MQNTILRSLNGMRKHAPTVQPADYPAFVSLARIWHSAVMKHHDSEEANFFLPLQERLNPEAMLASLHEHEAFHDGIGQLISYLDGLAGREAEFEPAEFSRIVDSFAEALVTHLHNEIPALMDLGRFGDVELVAETWYSGVQAEIKKTKASDMVTLVPMMILSHDLDYEGGLHHNFPPMPAPVRFMFRHLLSLPNRQAWKFLS